MSALDEPGLLASPPMPLRRPGVWMGLLALLLLFSGLGAIALPDGLSGPVLWVCTGYPVHQADVAGLAMLAAGSVLSWTISLVRQWQYTH